MNKNGSFFIGSIFIFIGIFWFLVSRDLIHFSLFTFLINFWPAILIVLGLNIVFRKNNFVRISSLVLIFIFLFIGVIIDDKDYKREINMILGTTNEISSENGEDYIKKSIKKENVEETKLALNLDYGEIEFNTDSENLIDFKIPYNGMEYSYTKKNKSSKLTFSDKDNIFKDNEYESEDRIYSYTLNNDVVWDVEINSGAVDGEFDFSKVHLKTLSFNLGAGDIEMKIGSKEKNCKMEVNSATIALEIDADKDLGIIVKNTGPILEFDSDEDEFIKDGNSYTSKNYSSSENKLEIQLNTALSNISINRY